MKLSSFAEIATDYQTVFFDAFGVLKTSSGVLPQALDLLVWLRQTGKDVFLLTNDASKAPAQMAMSYQHPKHGALLDAARVISSGLLAKEYLRAKVKHGKVAYLGGVQSAYYIEAAGREAIPLAQVEQADEREISALVLLDDEGFDWFRDVNRALNLLRRRTIPVIVANADAAYPVNQSDIAVAIGSLGRMMEGILQRSFTYFGKPDSSMFGYAFAAAVANDSALKKSKVLMVGDTLYTDIHGGNAFGIDTALVLSGNTQPSRYEMLVETTGIIPTYVCASAFT